MEVPYKFFFSLFVLLSNAKISCLMQYYRSSFAAYMETIKDLSDTSIVYPKNQVSRYRF